MSPAPEPPEFDRREYVALVLVVAAGLIVTAMFLTRVWERHGLIAPGASPLSPHPEPGTDGS